MKRCNPAMRRVLESLDHLDQKQDEQVGIDLFALFLPPLLSTWASDSPWARRALERRLPAICSSSYALDLLKGWDLASQKVLGSGASLSPLVSALARLGFLMLASNANAFDSESQNSIFITCLKLSEGSFGSSSRLIKRQESILSAFASVLKLNPSLFKTTEAVVLKDPQSFMVSIWMLLKCRVNLQLSFSDTDLSPYIDVLIKYFISCDKLGEETIENYCHIFHPLIHQLNEDQFRTSLLPSLSKFLLRSSQVVISALNSPLFLKSASFDLSPYKKELFDNFVKELESKDEGRQKQALELVSIFFHKCHDEVVSVCCLDLLNEELWSKTGKPKRDYILLAFAKFPLDQDSDRSKRVAAHLLTILENFIRKEPKFSSSKAQDSFLEALKVSLPLSFDSVDCNRCLKFLITILSSSFTSSVSSSALGSAFVFARCSESRKALDKLEEAASLASKVVETVSKSVGSSLIREIAVHSALICLNVKGCSREPLSSLRSSLFSHSSFLLDKAHILTYDRETCFSLIHFISHVLRQDVTDVERATLGAGLCFLLFHEQNDVRHRASRSLIAHVRSDALTISNVLEGCCLFFQDARNIRSFTALQRVIYFLCSADMEPRQFVLVGYLLHRGDFTVSEKKASSRFCQFNALVRFWNRSFPTPLGSFVQAHVSEISQHVFYLLEGYEHHTSREACMFLIVSLLNVKDNFTFVELMKNKVSSTLECSSLKSLSSDEIGIFETPEGEVYSGTSDDKDTRPKGRTKKKAHETEKEWEERVAKEIQEKRLLELKSQGIDPERDVKLREQSLVRAYVKNLRSLPVAYLSLFRLLAHICDPLIRDYLVASAFQPIMLLLKVPTMSTEVTPILFSLSNHLGPGIRSSVDTIQSMFLVHKYDVRELLQEEWRSDTIWRTVERIHDVSLLKPLKDVSFLAILDVLKYAILAPSAIKMPRDQVVVILENQCAFVRNKPSISFPYAEATSLLLSVVERFPVYFDSCSLSLSRITTHDERCTSLEVLTGDFGFLNPSALVRRMSVNAFACYPDVKSYLFPRFISRLWIVVHDSDTSQQVQVLASQLWSVLDLKIQKDCLDEMFDKLSHPIPVIRTSCARAVGACLGQGLGEDAIQSTLKFLTNTFEQNLIASYEIAEVNPLDVSLRSAVAQCFGSSGPHLSESQTFDVLRFLCNVGLTEYNESVWNCVLQSAIVLIDQKSSNLSFLNTVLKFLEEKIEETGKASDSGESDQIREGVSILMGTIGKYLPTGSPQVIAILKSLMTVLKTPSQSVQMATSDCMFPLFSACSNPEIQTSLIEELMDRLLNSSSYGDRKGASFGIAAFVKGMKIPSLKKFNIMSRFSDVFSAKKSDAKSREGILMAYEALFLFLGSKFEPYVIHILPHLLSSFGDSNTAIRAATLDASKALMTNLTAHGVKMILPLILKSFEDTQWRTKVESINMLGAMSSCAPQQLSASLPIIVPKLLDVLKDPHQKVHSSAKEALKDIGNVVQNPEIQALIPIILDALYEPADNTKISLQNLIDTPFVNAIDSPALALISPILNRGLRDRSGQVKRMAAQIVGSICSFLRDPSDLSPYIESLVVELRSSLIDPNPDVRAASARALGQLFRGVGKDQLIELINWLFNVLQNETSSVERSGGAQGLSELLSALGESGLKSYLPQIFEKLQSPHSHVRESFFAVMGFLPRSFGKNFLPALAQSVPILFDAFSDEKESVRTASLNACKSLVDTLGPVAPIELLHLMEPYLHHMNWRTREKSIIVIGDLLHKLVGAKVSLVSGEDIEYEEDNSTKPENDVLIEERLGPDRRNKLFSSLYILQGDCTPNVRNAAWVVWKSIVFNTTRLLGMIVNTFLEEVIVFLADSEHDRQSAATLALGELVRRIGDPVISIVLPVLSSCSTSDESNTRKGACMAMAEVLRACSRHSLIDRLEEFVPHVQHGLCDADLGVRVAASSSFDALYDRLPGTATEKVVSPILESLSQDNEQAELTLLGLKELLKLRSGPILGHLVPVLLKPPMTAFQARAIASLADVAADEFASYVGKVSTTFLQSIDEIKEDEVVVPYFKLLSLKVNQRCSEVLVSSLMDYINFKPKNTEISVVAAVSVLDEFCRSSPCSFQNQLDEILTMALSLILDDSESLFISGGKLLDSIVRRLGVEQLPSKAGLMRKYIDNSVTDYYGRRTKSVVSGLCVASTLSALMAVYQQSLLYGTVEDREESALGIGLVVELTTVEFFKPFVIKVTGALIRVVGDRFPSQVKSAILSTIGALLDKASTQLKAFVPQLQTILSKSLYDPSDEVRENAVVSMARLMRINFKKISSVVLDIASSIKGTEDHKVQSSLLDALYQIIRENGASVDAAAFAELSLICNELIYSAIELIRSSAGDLCGAVAKFTPEEEFASNLVKSKILLDKSADPDHLHGALSALKSFAVECPQFLSSDISKVLQLLGFCQKHSIVIFGNQSLAYTFVVGCTNGVSNCRVSCSFWTDWYQRCFF